MVSFVTSILALLLQSWVLSVMWSWFVVPAFGVKEIGTAVAFGLIVLLRQLTIKFDFQERTEQEKEFLLFASFAVPLIGLILGYIAQLFI